jgi:hypothetical protein
MSILVYILIDRAACTKFFTLGSPRGSTVFVLASPSMPFPSGSGLSFLPPCSSRYQPGFAVPAKRLCPSVSPRVSSLSRQCKQQLDAPGADDLCHCTGCLRDGRMARDYTPRYSRHDLFTFLRLQVRHLQFIRAALRPNPVLGCSLQRKAKVTRSQRQSLRRSPASLDELQGYG